MIWKLSDMQRIAREKRYAVPHFLGGNLEMTLGAVSAAEAMNSPIAIGVAPEVFARVPIEISFPMILNIASRAKVPVAVQLEHGKSYEQIAKAIKLGVNSVMFDGSALPYEENVLRTREIVRMAHALDVCVEAELGCVGGSAIRGAFAEAACNKTDPGQVLDFVGKTGVDALAVSFGNVHGHYRGKPDIDFELIGTVSRLTDIPLVMHGGSGLQDDVYGKIVAAGISNIHFYTGVAMYAWGELKKSVGDADPFPPYHEVVAHGVDFFYKKTMHIIGLLGSENKA
ncbi:MAG: class II fructose-bisphosphate aldolase [Candidatus Limiplasma sp.]|nr:class II fructose-bisphosphate aldolase [Candidatus Limiplasma sp.]